MMSRPGNAFSAVGEREEACVGLPLASPLGGRVTVSERQILGQILEQD